MHTYEKVAQILEVKSEDIEKESTKTFLELKLRNIEAEIFKIARRYGITCIEELERGGNNCHGRYLSWTP